MLQNSENRSAVLQLPCKKKKKRGGGVGINLIFFPSYQRSSKPRGGKHIHLLQAAQVLMFRLSVV